ncbi:hypothetical protein Poli38472_012271 [Pythium oligandrum]|uniref:MoaB/Mog domain-containing protein n=1 Tax=Pythium oligandrum TaxID=41045 RepID=A0A8K1FKI6_PYTOL|nr:hypothetical protein Poli38472_012271 [Pythium oligandrum]|eukprot:TMW67155.1 hypothetical protein Poli38472_012271 [Pythium oligandrum]
MMRVDEAVGVVLSHSETLGVEEVNAGEALGRVLAERALSTEPLPPFRASMMDGYAVVAADGVGKYPVINRIAAGDAPTGAIRAGQVAYITTGSPVPDGADAVVKIEDTDGVYSHNSEVAVKILKAVKPGQSIRDIGSDITPGEVLIDAHEEVTSAEIGLLAMTGVTTVKTFRQPVVGVLSTGTELVAPFAPTPPGKIRDSNRPMLLSLLASWKVKTLDLGICGDQKDALENTLRQAFEKVDVLITSGGVSMGDHDLIKPLLEQIGTVHFGRLFMKPGKPTTFATVLVDGKKKLVFALPGNPVSSFTTCHLLVRPALKKMQGYPDSKCRHTQVYATLSHSVRLDPERPEFHRATVVWDAKTHKLVATSTGRQVSSRLLSCRHANVLLSLPTGTDIREGDAVPALLLDDTFEAVAHATSPAPAPRKEAPAASTQTPAVVKTFRAGILTISDRVSRGDATDLSGPAMADVLAHVKRVKIDVIRSAVVPDEVDAIQKVVTEWTDADHVDLILTSGGTGFSPRDVTPEAIKAILHKEIPGFVIAMLESSLKITTKAMLSRPVAGIRARTLIVTLPGKPKAVLENLSAIEDVLPHALHLVRDEPHEHHRASPQLLYT